MFRRFADSLAELVVAIASTYEARARSAWRTYRVEPQRDADGLDEATSSDAAELGRLPVGTLLVTKHAATKRFARRGHVMLKLRADTWTVSHNRTWDGGELDEQLDGWLMHVRMDLALGAPVFTPTPHEKRTFARRQKLTGVQR